MNAPPLSTPPTPRQVVNELRLWVKQAERWEAVARDARLDPAGEEAAHYATMRALGARRRFCQALRTAGRHYAP